MASIDSDFRYRALYGRELATLVLSAWAGSTAAGFTAFLLSGTGLSAEATEIGTAVLLVALLPVLVTLVPGTLLQVAAAPNRGFRFHVRLSFVAGALYFVGFLALLGGAVAAEKQFFGAAPAATWIYWLIGPILVPALVAGLAEHLWSPSSD
jgi:hypothetical protein